MKRAHDATDEKYGVTRAKEAYDKADAELDDAFEAFMQEPATTPLGGLLKLKYAAEIDNLEDEHRKDPKLVLPRIVLG